MDDATPSQSQDSKASPPKQAVPVNEVRYSMKELMAAVADERRVSALGRELVDVHEIDKMFSKVIRRKKQ